MGIENLKRWHWIVIGLLIGAGLAYGRAQFSDHPTYTVRYGVSVERFIDLVGAASPDGRPALRDLVIHPPMDGKQLVTGRYASRGDEVFELMAPIPFRVRGQPAPEDASYSVREYLAANAPQIEYQYLWWKHRSIEPAIWMAGSVVVIGGLWPVVLNLLIGAGLGRKPEPKPPEYDLDRFGNEPEEAKAAAGVTEADLEKLHEVEEELERNLAAGAASEVPGEGSSPADARGAGTAAVKQLSNAPVEALQPLDREEDPHEYRGEYYPVAHPVRHEKPKEPSA